MYKWTIKKTVRKLEKYQSLRGYNLCYPLFIHYSWLCPIILQFYFMKFPWL